VLTYGVITFKNPWLFEHFELGLELVVFNMYIPKMESSLPNRRNIYVAIVTTSYYSYYKSMEKKWTSKNIKYFMKPLKTFIDITFSLVCKKEKNSKICIKILFYPYIKSLIEKKNLTLHLKFSWSDLTTTISGNSDLQSSVH